MAEARARLRPPPWERIDRYQSWRLPEETAYYLIRRGGAEIVDAVVEKTGADGLLAGIVIGQQGQGPPPARHPGRTAWGRPSGCRFLTA